jgi:pentatricopeptide repeat protein
MLYILSRHGNEDANLAWDLIDQMEREGVTGNISTVNLLIGMVGAHGVNRCMDLVKKWGLRLNGYTYKCIVQAYIRGRDVERGFRVYDEMKRKGYKLDIFAYNMLLHALAQASMVCLLLSLSSFFGTSCLACVPVAATCGRKTEAVHVGFFSNKTNKTNILY